MERKETNEWYASRKERALQRSIDGGTMWSDTKTPWEDLAKEDMERINAWLHGVACNWSF